MASNFGRIWRGTAHVARVTTLMWERLGLRYSLERRSSWCFWLSGWGTKELEGLVGLGGDATDVRHQQWFGRRVRGAHTVQVLISWYFHVFPIRAKAKHDIWTLSSPQVGCRWRVRRMVLVVNGCNGIYMYIYICYPPRPIFESWILNPTPLELRKNAFWMHSLQNPRSQIQDSHKFCKQCNFWSPENALSIPKL